MMSNVTQFLVSLLSQGEVGYACLSFSMEQLDSHWTDFHEILYLSIFLKFSKKNEVLLKSEKNNVYFT